MAAAGAEIGKRHFVGAADPRIHVVNLTGKSVWRQPLDHGVGI
jgi:hypothetical protein